MSNRVTTFDGTLGTHPGAGATGFESIGSAGGGDWTIIDDDLTGEGGQCVNIVGGKWGVDVVADQKRGVRGYFRLPIGVTPSGSLDLGNALTTGGAVSQAQLTLTPAGHIRLRHQGVLDQELSKDFRDGEIYQYIWNVDGDANTHEFFIWREGYSGHLSGVTGTGSIDKMWQGICTNVTYNIDADQYEGSDTLYVAPPQFALSYVKVGAPTPSGLQVVTTTMDVTHVRADIFRRTTDSYLMTSSEFAVGAHNQTTIEIDSAALEPLTEYEMQLYGLREGDWGSIGDRISGYTAPVPGVPVSELRVAAVGCDLDDMEDEGDFTYLEILNLYKPHFWLHHGDWDYSNSVSLIPQDHRDHWNSKLSNKPMFGQMVQLITMLHYMRSDHCGGTTNDASEQDPPGATEANQLAYLDTFPHVAIPEFPGEAVALCGAVQLGRWLFIFSDFRTLDRTDSTESDSDTVGMAVGAGQEAWLIEQIHRTDNGIEAKIFCTDAPWPGTKADVAPKDDHWACYAAQRDRIAAEMVGERIAIVQGDYHGLVYHSNSPYGNVPILGCSGATNNSGNIREDDWGNYEQIWAEDQDPQIDIFVYGQINLTDVDGVMTVELIGRDAQNEIDRVGGSTSWLVPYVPGMVPVDDALLADYQFQFHDLLFGVDRSLNVKAFNPGSAPIRSQVGSIPNGDGHTFGRDYIDGPTWGWTLYSDETTAAESLAVFEETAKKWRWEPRRRNPGEVVEMRYRLAGRERMVYGRPGRFAYDPFNFTLDQGRLEGAAEWICADHYTYAAQVESITVDLVPATVGGITFPITFPLTTLESEGPREGQFTIGGTAPTWVMIRIRAGESSLGGPTVRIDGIELEFRDIVLPPGQSINIDPKPWARTILSGGGSVAGALSGRTYLADLQLNPGYHEVVFNGLDPSNTADVTVSWRAAYFGL